MEKKIDRRKHYFLVLDTETANTLVDENGKLDMSSVLVYDCGWCVCDTHGKVYKTQSWINTDIFIHEKELMKTAYYANKIPGYWKDIWAGNRKMGNFYTIRKAILEDIETYQIKEVCAHNARFDVNALNTTRRYLTNSKYRYFFPYGIEIWDSLKMARSVIGQMPTYKKFCKDNNYVCKNGQLRFTAEILYRFISGNNDFEEKHTGLEDVMIEKEIVSYCYRQHKKMNKVLYGARV